VYGTVTQHRGWLEVESVPGRGSTFRVHLPAALPGDAVGAAAESPARQPAVRVPRLVLVVDDEEVVREFAMRLLERAGCRVLGAQDGAEALELVRRHGGGIDCMLIDLTMPGPPVPEVLAVMREIAPGMRVVVTSGYSQETARLQEIEGLTFLPKPYTPGELLGLMCGEDSG